MNKIKEKLIDLFLVVFCGFIGVFYYFASKRKP
jgi:hypothetical protein